jgi:hypothetical protein
MTVKTKADSTMKKHDFAVAIASILLGALVFYLSADLSGYDEHGVPGERFWPRIIAGLFIFLGGLQVVVTFFSPAKDGVKVDLSSLAVRMAYVSAFVSALYGLLLLLAGFVVATLVFIPAMTTLMGERRPWVSATVAVAVTGVIYFFFAVVFNSSLPASLLME